MAEAILGFFAHDLRAPLGPLALSVSAIAEDQKADPELREIAGIAHAQTQRLARLIDGLLIAIRGLRDLDTRAIDVAEIARQSLQDARALGVTCRLDSPASCPGQGDEEALRQALTGLLECPTSGSQTSEMKVAIQGGSIRILISPGAHGRFATPPADVPRDAESVFALSADRIFRAHGGAIEFSESRISAWLPTQNPT